MSNKKNDTFLNYIMSAYEYAFYKSKSYISRKRSSQALVLEETKGHGLMPALKRRTPELTEQEKKAVIKLIQSKLSEFIGYYVTIKKLESRRFQGGMVSDFVGAVEVPVIFAVKIDNDDSLRREVLNYEQIPKKAKTLFPRILGARIDQQPYVIVMEFFKNCKTYHSLLFEENTAATTINQVTARVLGSLFGIYEESKEGSSKPNLKELYFNRIKQRISSIESDHNFKDLISKRIQIENRTFDPINETLKRIEKKIDMIEPNFSTFMHGDLHAENICVINQNSRATIKIVDLESVRLKGDYLYDIGKFLHWIDVYWLIKTSHDSDQKLKLKRIDEKYSVKISYKIPTNSNARAAAKVAHTIVSEFANKYDVKKWRARLALSEASALLGSPMRIMNKWCDVNSATIAYVEGLKRLDACERFIDA